jgi:hypothetical protein
MKKLILLAGAVALASAGTALAKPGNGKGHGNAIHGNAVHGNAVHGNAVHGNAVHGKAVGYGVGGCPPGLAKKAVPCVPPGQAKFAVGQRIPLGYDRLLGYNSLPRDLRGYYGRQLDPRSRYIYDNNYIYRVNPRTMLVQQVLSALVRPY